VRIRETPPITIRRLGESDLVLTIYGGFMTFKRIAQSFALGLLLVGGSALAAPMGAMASTPGNPLIAHGAERPGVPLVNCIRFDTDDPLVCGVLRKGPAGKRGPKGPRGRRGYRGFKGPLGPVGPRGPQGIQGGQGIQGIQGLQGDPGPTIQAAGNVISNTNGLGANETGLELPPSVALCPPSNPEAYGGGAQIIKSGAHSTGDVVTLENSFQGHANGASEVDPMPGSGVPFAGQDSASFADAYEAQAVITELGQGDQVTVQAFATCGP
jgi:hypothetical protein